MGKAIYYCVECSRRVTESEIDAGKAFRFGDRILCLACAPDSVKTQSTKKVASRPRPTPPARPAVSLPPGPPSRRKSWILGGAAVGAVALVVLLALMLRSPKPSASVVSFEPAPLPTTVEADSSSRRESAAAAELQQARIYSKAHPEDLPGRARAFDDLRWKWEGTRAAQDAGVEHAALKALIGEQVAAGMAELQTTLADPEKREDYKAAIEIAEKAKAARPDPEWKLAVEKKISELYGKLRRQREAAATPLPEIPAPPPPLSKAPSEELRGWLPVWEAAVAKATARDYGAAIAELGKAAALLKEEDAKKQASDDLGELQAIAAVSKAGLEALRSRARGSGLSLVYRGDAGPARAGGTVLQNGAERVQLLGAKGLVFVDWSEVSAETIGKHASKADPRTLALFCLLEGEREPAKEFGVELPPKWTAYADGARARIPKPDPAERNARNLYASAENAWRSMETRGTAIEGYRTLKADFASSPLVKAALERISRRAEAGKDYLFLPADIRVEGSFKLSKSGKIESLRDSDDPDTLRNQAEIEFAVLPGLTYRCWLWAGACCEETFLFYYQGTELVDTDARTKKKISCDLGSNAASSVKHGLRNLKRTHALHALKKEAKAATRWEWIEIPLPKYPSPGAKKLRFMTNQAGFSIGAAVLSSSRKVAPADAELKDLEAFRPQDDPGLPVDPDLVGWWTFDEGAGVEVADLSGKGHPGKLTGTCTWTEGKIGGGLKLGGGQSGVQIADAEDLRLAGDMTAALWFRKDEEVGDWFCLVGKGLGQQRNFAVWMEARTKQILFQQYGPSALGLKTEQGVDAGAWHHVACVIEGSRARVYIDGAKAAETDRKGIAETPPHPVGIGWGCDHAGLIGAVDDVRLYRRALSAEEVQGLYTAGK